MDVPTNLDIDHNNELVSKEGLVAPQDILEDTNSLTVTKKLTPDVVKCAGCGAEVTVLRYREEDGWRCERCAPAKQPCENQDCTDMNIDNKSGKHETFFCQQRTRCEICEADVSGGTLSAHYGSEHQDITCRAGSTWRATRTRGWGYRLVSSVAGTAMCVYFLNDKLFELYVFIPVSNERLREFCCELKVTDLDTGCTQTYSPDVVYNKWWDWHIHVEKEELSSSSREFDVVVNIKEIQ